MTIDHSFRSVLVFCVVGLTLRGVAVALPQIARDLPMLIGVTLFGVSIVLLGYGLAAVAMHTTRL